MTFISAPQILFYIFFTCWPCIIHDKWQPCYIKVEQSSWNSPALGAESQNIGVDPTQQSNQGKSGDILQQLKIWRYHIKNLSLAFRTLKTPGYCVTTQG